MKRARVVKVSTAAAIVLLIAGCTSGGGATNPAPPESHAPSASHAPTSSTGATEPLTITIRDFEFRGPASVPPGATVTVTNMDSAAHTVTADDGDSFDVTIDGNGGTATFTAPSEPGGYDYHCAFHPNMQATLTVKAES
jgi:plastocyanin